MTLTVAQMTLPSRPYAWRGEASLAEIAHTLAEADPDDTVLIAGCQVVVARTGAVQPAGESAVLWLAGRDGPVHLTRGNLLRRKRGGPDCCSRSCAGAERTERPPEACALFFSRDWKRWRIAVGILTYIARMPVGETSARWKA